VTNSTIASKIDSIVHKSMHNLRKQIEANVNLEFSIMRLAILAQHHKIISTYNFDICKMVYQLLNQQKTSFEIINYSFFLIKYLLSWEFIVEKNEVLDNQILLNKWQNYHTVVIKIFNEYTDKTKKQAYLEITDLIILFNKIFNLKTTDADINQLMKYCTEKSLSEDEALDSKKTILKAFCKLIECKAIPQLYASKIKEHVHSKVRFYFH
jgi:hypothetical protein